MERELEEREQERDRERDRDRGNKGSGVSEWKSGIRRNNGMHEEDKHTLASNCALRCNCSPRAALSSHINLRLAQIKFRISGD